MALSTAEINAKIIICQYVYLEPEYFKLKTKKRVIISKESYKIRLMILPLMMTIQPVLITMIIPHNPFFP